MHVLIQTFLVFLKIGAFSFGGGYAMLPLIEKEIVEIHNYMTKNQFIDIVAISQMTPGPIAINSATFIGFINYGVIGSALATIGVITGPFIYMNGIVNRFLDKFKDSDFMKVILIYLRAVTVSLIFSTFLSTLFDMPRDIFNFSVFIASFVLIQTKKLSTFQAIVLFGIIGIIKEYFFM